MAHPLAALPLLAAGRMVRVMAYMTNADFLTARSFLTVVFSYLLRGLSRLFHLLELVQTPPPEDAVADPAPNNLLLFPSHQITSIRTDKLLFHFIQGTVFHLIGVAFQLSSLIFVQT